MQKVVRAVSVDGDMEQARTVRLTTNSLVSTLNVLWFQEIEMMQ